MSRRKQPPPESPPPTPEVAPLAAALRGDVTAVCLVALAAFVLTLRARFLYDDTWTIVENPFIRRLGNLTRLFSHDYFTQVPDNNRPVMVVLTMIDYQLSRLRPGGYHLHSVLWHCAASALVYVVVLRRLAERHLALAAALLFAVHPLHVEPVAAINYREDLLATTFLLATFALILAAREGGRRRLWLAATGTWLLALFSKESALVFPLLLLASDAFAAEPGQLLRRWRQRGREYLWLIGVAAAVFVPFALAFRRYSSVALGAGTLGPRVFSAARVAGTSLLQLVVPVGLSAEYDVTLTGASDPRNWVAIAALVALVIAALRARRRWPVLAFGAAWLLLALLPTLNLLPIHNPRADRYLYLPSVGFCVAAAWALLRLGAWLAQRSSAATWRARMGWVPLALCLVVLVPWTWRRTLVWRTSATLWRDAVQTAPRSLRAWSGLAFAEVEAGRFVAARAAAERGLELSPQDGRLHMARGMALADAGAFDAAVADLTTALQSISARERPRLYNNLGIALMRQGQLPRAETAIRQALALWPGSEKFHRNLGQVLEKQGRREEALREYRTALALLPGDQAARRAIERLTTAP